jgi:hypothetical protein
VSLQLIKRASVLVEMSVLLTAVFGTAEIDRKTKRKVTKRHAGVIRRARRTETGMYWSTQLYLVV